jgi:hypothetical protein
MSKSPAGTVGTPVSAPSGPPPSTATPPPGAAKKKRVRAPAADGATPPPAKKPKKTEASPKKTAAKRKPKESEDADEQEVGEKEQERRLALIEAEELEMKSVVEEDTDANTWQDNTYGWIGHLASSPSNNHSLCLLILTLLALPPAASRA